LHSLQKSTTDIEVRGGIRFSKSKSGKLQIVGENQTTGGSTELEAGVGRFNRVTQRKSSSFLDLINDTYMKVGNSGSGKKVVSPAIYGRTGGSSANVQVTSAGTL